MQCRRARLPVVAAVSDLSDLAGRPGLVIATPNGGPAGALPLPPEGVWTVVVGPEGGFDPGEVERPRPKRAPRALSLRAPRRETAPIVAAALAMAPNEPDVARDAAITLCESPSEA